MQKTSIGAGARAAFFLVALSVAGRAQEPPVVSPAGVKPSQQESLQGWAAELYGSDDAAKWHALLERTPVPYGLVPGEPLSSPAPASAQPSPGTVSVSRLRHAVPKDARKAYRRALQLSQSGDYSGAARELEKSVAKDPDFAEAHIDLGVQYFRLDRYLDATEQLQRAVELDPSSSIAYANLGAAQLGTGNREAAEKSERRALELSASNDRARYVLGLALIGDLKTRAEGRRQLEYAARTIPGAQAALKALRGN